MDSLSATQKMEMATSFAALALYDAEAEISSESISELLKATNNEVEAFYPIIFANFLTAEKISEIVSTPAGAGSGGGAAGGAGGEGGEEEEEEKEKVEEEEMDLSGGMDMFGGEGGDGDY